MVNGGGDDNGLIHGNCDHVNALRVKGAVSQTMKYVGTGLGVIGTSSTHFLNNTSKVMKNSVQVIVALAQVSLK